MVSNFFSHISSVFSKHSSTPQESDSNISSSLTLSAIWVNTEAAKENARRAQPDTSKILKANRHAKNVQLTHISLNKASRRKQIVKNVPRKNQLE